MKKVFLAAVLLLGSTSLFAGPRFFVGVGAGPGWYGPPPPAVPAAAYYAPAARPGYSWVGGYWYPNGGRYAWRAGYWARPSYAGASWVGPRYYGHTYYRGYWRR